MQPSWTDITDSMIYTDIDSAVLIIKAMQGKLGADALSGTKRGIDPRAINLPQRDML